MSVSAIDSSNASSALQQTSSSQPLA